MGGFRDKLAVLKRDKFKLVNTSSFAAYFDSQHLSSISKTLGEFRLGTGFWVIQAKTIGMATQDKLAEVGVTLACTEVDGLSSRWDHARASVATGHTATIVGYVVFQVMKLAELQVMTYSQAYDKQGWLDRTLLTAIHYDNLDLYEL